MRALVAFPGQVSVPRVPLSKLLFTDNVPAGLDILRLCHFAAILRKSNEPLPPIVIAPITGTGLYRVSDGRHRVIASFIAGRTDVAYELDPDDPGQVSCASPSPGSAASTLWPPSCGCC